MIWNNMEIHEIHGVQQDIVGAGERGIWPCQYLLYTVRFINYLLSLPHSNICNIFTALWMRSCRNARMRTIVQIIPRS